MFFIKPVYAQNEIINNALGSASNMGAGEGVAFYIAQLWKTVIILGGLAFLVYLIWGGLDWLMAGGDKGKVDTAQHKITNALTGLAILIGSYAIIYFVGGAFNLNLLQPVFPDNR